MKKQVERLLLAQTALSNPFCRALSSPPTRTVLAFLVGSTLQVEVRLRAKSETTKHATISSPVY